ncbi:MAG: IspD/TarI family cytidylyltransferase [Lachnospiraceae bacterium]|nr:IspD/TarI family cytidylyltransferase [Lachnospiraceae bacterium]
MNTNAILLAGGIGSRLGGLIPKQYREIGGKPMIYYSLRVLMEHVGIETVRIVADESWHAFIQNCINTPEWQKKFSGFSKPGENRQISIRNALEDMQKKLAVKTDNNVSVLIHDAARPFLSGELLDRLLAAIDGNDGVLPVLPMKDTVYYSEDGKYASSLLDRSKVLAGQAPELFDYAKYWEANNSLSLDEMLQINGSTEPAVKAGMKISFIAGDEQNYKVTTEADWIRAKEVLEKRSFR